MAFTDKPKTIPTKEYDAVIDMDYDEEQKWKKWNLFDVGMLVKNKDIISKIDWDIFK